MLKPMGHESQDNFRSKLSGYSLDALVTINDEKIGVEIDRPCQIVGSEPKGHILLKRRQVAAIDGIRIVSVPYWKWNGGDKRKKQKYRGSYSLDKDVACLQMHMTL